MLLSVLIFSCDPDKEEKKKTTTQDKDKDDKNDKLPETPAPVVSLDAVSSKTDEKDGGEDARTKADKSDMELGWVFQGKEITFSTTAKDKDDNEIPKAKFKWEWRKRGKTETTIEFGHTWTPIKDQTTNKEQTTKTATLTIPTKQRVGAYELRVSATSGGKTVKSPKEENPKTYYRFTVRKDGCAPPSTKYRPATFDDLVEMVNLGSRKIPDGDVPAIDISRVTSMYAPFGSKEAKYNNVNFNLEINCWDVSNVTNMQGMFQSLSMFNQDIGDWDTSKVTTMSEMFKDASAFNQDISRWDTSGVRYMRSMFNGAVKFNQDLSDWDVSKIAAHDNFSKNTPDWDKANEPDWSKTP